MDDFSSQIRFPTPNCWHRFWWFQLVDPMSNSSKKVKKSSNCWHRFWWFQLVALSKMVPIIWWFFHFFWWFLFGKSSKIGVRWRGGGAADITCYRPGTVRFVAHSGNLAAFDRTWFLASTFPYRLVNPVYRIWCENRNIFYMTQTENDVTDGNFNSTRSDEVDAFSVALLRDEARPHSFCAQKSKWSVAGTPNSTTLFCVFECVTPPRIFGSEAKKIKPNISHLTVKSGKSSKEFFSYHNMLKTQPNWSKV